MPVHKKKFVPKGIAKTLGTLCEKFEAAKRAPARKAAKKRKSSKRDPAVVKRKIKRRTVRTASGPWVFRDPAAYGTGLKKRKVAKKRKTVKKTVKKRTTKRRDPAWVGESARHAAASRFGWGERFGRTNIKTHAHPIKKAKKRSSARDWPGHPILHKRAALLGIRRTKAKKAKRSKAKKRSSARDWPGHPILHSRSAKLGVRRAKRAGRRDPMHMGPTRRPSKNRAGHWDMSYTRAMRDSY